LIEQDSLSKPKAFLLLFCDQKAIALSLKCDRLSNFLDGSAIALQRLLNVKNVGWAKFKLEVK
jgi:hypothetical protein